MKFTLSWLKEYLDTKAELPEIATCLTQIGLEVESVEDKASELSNFNVVEVINVAKHPDADRLNLCTVKTKTEEFQLVCGASNVTKNMKAVLAPLGSIVPANQMKVKKVKIRGVESIGMLCSAKELCLGDDHEGIIDIDKNTEIGTNVAEALGMADPVIEIAITPNRGDCLGVYGIARDLAAAGLGELKPHKELNLKQVFDSNIKAKINEGGCKSLNLLEIKNVKNIPSPDWLQSKIKAIGIQPKSAIVDITNYILYCYGQPLHAYDKSKIKGDVLTAQTLGQAQDFTALDDNQYKIPPESLVIADQGEIASLAGIIGGKSSACDDQTTNIILEAANFKSGSISSTGRKLQIDTDSRYRFERKIDPLFAQKALYYAASLIQEICGGEISNLIKAETETFAPKEVTLSLQKLNDIAADNISVSEIEQIFTNLGFNIKKSDQENITIEVPSWRNDVAIEADLIEEILRLRDFNKIPYVSFQNDLKKEFNYLDLDKEFAIKRLLASLGLDEVITWSFYSSNETKLYNFPDNLQIQNPISNDLSILRNSLIPNLVNMILQEQNKGNQTTTIFEYGKIFQEEGEEILQDNAISAVRIGPRNVKEVNNFDQNYDIFDVKEDVYSLLKFLNIEEFKVKIKLDDILDFLHPKRSAKLFIGKKQIGYFGELHPAITKKLGIKQRVNLFELFLANLPTIKDRPKKYTAIELQSVNRDFCFIVSEDILSGDIKEEILRTDTKLIKEVKIFDLYRGEKLEEGKKSLAFNVTLQPKEVSLTGEELELFNQKVINNVSKKFSATLPQ